MRRRQIFAERSHAGISDPIVVEAIPDAPEAAIVPPPDPHACPKCGKVVRRGMYFHKKYCKG